MRERIQAYLKASGHSIWSAPWSCSPQTVYAVVKGRYKRAQQRTLHALMSELDRLEVQGQRTPTGKRPPVEVLPDKLPRPARRGSLPALEPPPRHGKVP